MYLKLALVWLVPLLACGCGESVELQWDPVRRPLRRVFQGSPELPVAGVANQDGQATIFAIQCALDAGDVPNTVQLLQSSDALVLSDDSNAAGIATYPLANRTEFRWVDEPTAVLTLDEHRTFAVSDDATTLVSIFRPTGGSQDHRVEIHDHDGSVRAVYAVPGVSAVRISRDGGRIAVLARDEVVFLDRDGEVLSIDPPALDLRFSPSGRWDARFVEGELRLRDGGRPSRTFETEGLPLDAAFDASEELFGFVDRENFHLVDLAHSLPKDVLVEPAAGASEYRSIVCAPDGYIALGRIEVMEFPRRDAAASPIFVPGKGEISVDFVDVKALKTSGVLRGERHSTTVTEWNKESPILTFSNLVYVGTWQAVYVADFP